MTEVLAKILTYGLPFIVLFTGLVWLTDALFFAKARKARLALVEGKFAGREKMSPAEQQAFEVAKQTAAEPTVVEYSKSFFPVLFLVFFIRSFLFEPFQIPSGSMIPTLKIGDFILVNKFTYGIRVPILNKEIIPVNKPQRGEVMVFYPPHQPGVTFIKRVIGLPGDKIHYTNHVLYINGVEQKYTETAPEDLKEFLEEFTGLGSTVTLRELKSQQLVHYLLVGPSDEDKSNHLISIKSSLGQKLKGKRIGDKIEINDSLGKREFMVEKFAEYCSDSGDTLRIGFESIGEKIHPVRKCPKPSHLSVDGEWTVPDGHYFVMGDNRDRSSDSRDTFSWKFNFVSEDKIVGKAVVVWMHWDDFLSIPSFKTVGVIR